MTGRVGLLAVAYLLAALVGYGGYKARALSGDGAVAACAVGGTIFGFGGVVWALLLVLFFATSSMLSFFQRANARKRTAAEFFEKGGRRDAGQVFANGGVAALIAFVAFFAAGSSMWVFFASYTGALAAATADTWATEIGVLSRDQPRMITTGKPVAAGASGGITWLGSGAAALGAFCIGIAATIFALFTPSGAASPSHLAVLFLAGQLGGVAGAFADSLLGATLQASYRCPRCRKPTESCLHNCGTETRLTRGIPWVNNDLVNLAATAVGAVTAALLVLSRGA